MSLWSRLFGRVDALPPRASGQPAAGGTLIVTPDQLEEALRAGNVSASGAPVTTTTAMRTAAVFACVRILSGVPANMPLDIKKRVNDRTREDASNHPLWRIFRRRPNRWQTPSQFKRMMTAHLKLRGNAYAHIVRSRGNVLALVPLHPDRVRVRQLDDLSLEYTYTRRNGGRVTLDQSEVFHLVGLSLDGITGVSVLTYARETIGLSLTMENHGAATFKNGARVSMVLKHPGQLGPEGLANLKASLDEYRAGGESEGKSLILEEGMDTDALSMTAEDAQWIESRKFSRTDIAMFFGVPPFMLGDTEKSTSWGTGIEQQKDGFLAFAAEDDLTTWEETINCALIADDESEIYARFNRASLVRGNLKDRFSAYQIGRQIKVFSANDVRAMEDLNPVDGGDVYENPAISTDNSEDRDEPAPAA